MYNTQEVAEKIRKARLHKNYSQDYLAAKLKISQNAYSKIECGYTKVPLERLIVIAQVLDVKLTNLLGAINADEAVEAVKNIAIVPRLLEVICKTTGMGFAAVARVTEDKWIACAVRDEINFGLKPGSELVLETTICNEIRQHQKSVVIDCVELDENFARHPTPAMYGFQSYISVPIISKDGSFFGTLCAIDPKPAKINNTHIIEMFTLFADMISIHLNVVDAISA
jgi:transcriptional regulator with XRE-family HTH domain